MNRGMTIVELLVTVFILGILVLIMLPQFSKMRENQVLKNAVEDVFSALNKARAQTLASVDSSEYGVHFQSDQVIIFKGEIFSSGAAGNEVINITAPGSITNVTLGGVSGPSGDIYFYRLYGAPNTTGAITVSTVSAYKIITVSATGAVSAN